MYQHRDWQGALLELPVSKVVCVGNNYRDHIREMGSQVAPQPVLFIKPESALCDLRQPIVIPHGLGEVHHEVELAVLIGTPLSNASEDRVARAIAGYGVALDLTLRAGDVVLTGTPAGVGPLCSGDMLSIGLNQRSLTTRVI